MNVYIFEKLELDKIEILEMFEPKLGKLVSKLKFKLKKFIFLKLDMPANSNYSSLMKLKFMKC